MLKRPPMSKSPNYAHISREIQRVPVLCSRCHTKNAQLAHHVDCNPENDAPENLVPLCEACHHVVHKELRLLNPREKKRIEVAIRKVLSGLSDADVQELRRIIDPKEKLRFILEKLQIINTPNNQKWRLKKQQKRFDRG